jgi:hypothetical protein
MNTVISPNMNLPVPVTGVDPGPDYANNVNNSLNLVDAHDHSPGKGVLVTPAGLNINVDLTMNNNNLISSRALRLQTQPSTPSNPSDLQEMYSKGGDLYYIDGVGNNVRITQSGGIAGSPGSISGLVPPASATYVSGTSTFVWQSGVNLAANLDGGSLILRNLTVSSPGLTLSPPTLSSNYTITLPLLPAARSYLTIDNSGNMAVGAVYGGFANTTSGTFSTTSATFVPVTNQSVSITTNGGGTSIILQAAGGAGVVSKVGTDFSAEFGLSTASAFPNMLATVAIFSSGGQIFLPPAVITFSDLPSAGTTIYTLYARAISGGTAYVDNCVMVVREL